MASLVGQFLVAIAITQAADPHYSSLTNYLSDLGNTAESSLWWLFNTSAVVLGGGIGVSAYQLSRWIPPTRRSAAGGWLMVVGGFGLLLVGCAPENVSLSVHTAGTLLFFIGIVVGLLFWSKPIGRTPTLPPWTGLLTLLCALCMIAFFSALVYAESSTFLVAGGGGYPGLLERLAVAPLLLWMVVVGVVLGRTPAPRGSVLDSESLPAPPS